MSKRRFVRTEADPGEYGRNIADDYDAIYGEAFETGAAVDQLVDLAGGGPVLELGVGTGRLALPLEERGLGNSRCGRVSTDAALASREDGR